MDWLYAQKLPESDKHWLPEDGKSAAVYGRQVTITYVEAYVFADRFQAPEFKKAVLQKISTKLVSYSEVIVYAFNHLPGDDILLELLVDIRCAYYKSGPYESWEIEDPKILPHDFLVRVMVRFCEHGRKVRFDASKYNLDNNEEPDNNYGWG